MKIYIDGCCAVHTSKNGAWAYVAIEPSLEQGLEHSSELAQDVVICENSGFVENTTNSRMELEAAVIATRWCILNKVSSAEIISDSSYLINGITEWFKGWLYNGWKTSAGEDVKNKDLWRDLIGVKSFGLVDIKWTWVKCHSGDKWNEYVDHLCKLVAEQTPVGELKAEEMCYTPNGIL